jgi:hypothetical protein
MTSLTIASLLLQFESVAKTVKQRIVALVNHSVEGLNTVLPDLNNFAYRIRTITCVSLPEGGNLRHHICDRL